MGYKKIAIVRRAASEPPRSFVESTLFSDSPFAFRERASDYQVFVQEISRNLDVEIEGIRIVGSGSLGFSLHPDHLLSPFSSDSDIDVVVASCDVFRDAWIDILNLADDTALLDMRERKLWRKSRENISDGFMRPDQMPLSSSLVRQWFPLISGPYESIVARQHQVTAWLFFSLEHATIFYSRWLERVQPALTKILKRRGGTT